MRLKVGDFSQKRTVGEGMISNVARVFFALRYLLGKPRPPRIWTDQQLHLRTVRQDVPFRYLRWTVDAGGHAPHCIVRLVARGFWNGRGNPAPQQRYIRKDRLGGKRVVQLVPRTVGSRILGNSGIWKKLPGESNADSPARAPAVSALLVHFDINPFS